MLKGKLGFLGGKLKRKVMKSVSAVSIEQPNSKDLCWLLKNSLSYPETRARLGCTNTPFEVR